MLGRAEIAERIPHGGRMCLLDNVLAWDHRHIRCAAVSHRDIDHPLREPGGLPVWAGIEYAAQVVAVHAALLRDSNVPRSGVLGGVRNVRPGCQWLDRVATELVFTAELLHSDPAGAIYKFSAHGDGTLLLEGRFTLVYTAGAPRTEQ